MQLVSLAVLLILELELEVITGELLRVQDLWCERCRLREHST